MLSTATVSFLLEGQRPFDDPSGPARRPRTILHKSVWEEQAKRRRASIAASPKPKKSREPAEATFAHEAPWPRGGEKLWWLLRPLLEGAPKGRSPLTWDGEFRQTRIERLGTTTTQTWCYIPLTLQSCFLGWSPGESNLNCEFQPVAFLSADSELNVILFIPKDLWFIEVVERELFGDCRFCP